MTNILNGDVQVTGNLSIAGNLTGHSRSDLDTESGSKFPINLTDFRVHDAFQTVLPGTSAADDLGLYGQTFGTNSPQIMSYDVKTVGATTLYARAMVQLPMNYVGTGSVAIVAHAGMEGAVADTSCTLDLEVYKSDGAGGIGSDLQQTAAITINSLTFADRTFSINAAGLAPGDWLDIRFAVAVNDGAGGSSVQAAIGKVDLSCTTRG